MLDAIDSAGTGLSAYRTMLDTTAYNIANVNTARATNQPAFAGQYVQLQELGAGADGVGQGVEVKSLQTGDTTGRMTYDPTNPLADTQGYVRLPDIDLSDQMTNMIIAERGFQANASAVSRAKDVYDAAIAIGKGA